MGTGGGANGGSNRYRQLRMARFGLLAVVLIAGATLHHSGSAYSAIRGLYFIVIIGFLFFSFSRRRGGSRSTFGAPRSPFGRQGLSGRQTIDVTPNPPTPSEVGARPIGWFPDPSDADVERYWNGTGWGQVRRRVNGLWVEE